MTNNIGFSIRIFIPDGEPDGIRIVEKSNWTGQAIVVPRPCYKSARDREQLNRTGIYILTAPLEMDDLPVVYIGEGDPVRPRIDSHLANKDFWTTATVFSSKDLNFNKAHVQYLESRLITLAREAKRCKLDNGNQPNLPSLSEADIADMETFLNEMLLIFPSIGLTFFEKPLPPNNQNTIYNLKGKGITAKGYEDPQGFVVMKGAMAVNETTPSIHNYMIRLRESLQKEEILVSQGDKLVLSQDYTFSSPSTAAGVLLGRSANGRTDWKDDNGVSIKDQESIEE
jgi:hypothetical protein